MYDVIVVGSGPGGSSAARICAENDLKTLIIEKEKLPRDKPCAGGVIDFDKFNFDKSIIENHVDKVNLYLNFKKLASGRVPFSIVNREKFDYYLANQAKKAGAELMDGDEVVSIDIKEGLVRTRNGSYQAKIIIGADGISSTVAKSSGLYRKRRITTTLFTECKSNIETCDLFFFNKFIGYSWIFPKKGSISIGSGCFENGRDLKTFLSKVVDEHNIDLGNNKLISYPIPQSLLPKIYTNKVLLVGDAAGFTNPFTGEGIAPAIKSGRKAGLIAIKAVEKNNFSEKFLSQYKDLCSDMIWDLRKARIYLWMLKFLMKTGLMKPAISFLKLIL